MKTRRKILSSLILSTALACTMAVSGNAAGINIHDNNISMEATCTGWKEISDPDTMHTFTNGTDQVTVLRYSQSDTLPAPTRPDTKYTAVYQTYYSTGDSVYVITGLAVDKEDISGVRKIVENISCQTEEQAFTHSSDHADSSASADRSDGADTSASVPKQGWDSMLLYDTNLNNVSVTRSSDGLWYDETGVCYGNLDEADCEKTIYNSDGEAYYWNGALAQEAADASSQETDSSYASDEVCDPFDLYSWDALTDSYIPYQQADGSSAPIGRGNGWYYYDADTDSFLPW